MGILKFLRLTWIIPHRYSEDSYGWFRLVSLTEMSIYQVSLIIQRITLLGYFGYKPISSNEIKKDHLNSFRTVCLLHSCGRVLTHNCTLWCQSDGGGSFQGFFPMSAQGVSLLTRSPLVCSIEI